MALASGGMAMLGCVVLGVGIGMFLEHMLPGLVTGVGAGFIALAGFAYRDMSH